MSLNIRKMLISENVFAFINRAVYSNMIKRACTSKFVLKYPRGVPETVRNEIGGGGYSRG